MPTFHPAPQDVRELVRETIEDYRPDLIEAGVTVNVLMAIPTDRDMANDPPYLKLHGYGAAATVKITPYIQRVQGIADATITIDDETWKTLDHDGRVALIWHESLHLIVCKDKDGLVKTDDCGRPRLKMRLHDHQCGVFNEVIERYGVRSIDGQVVHALLSAHRQTLFGWADDMAPQDAMPADALRDAG